MPWAGDVWGSQRHGGECCISPADSRARAVGPGGSASVLLYGLPPWRARFDLCCAMRGPGFDCVAALRARVRIDSTIFSRLENARGSAAHEHLCLVCTMPRQSQRPIGGNGHARRPLPSPRSRFESSDSLRNLPPQSSASTRRRPSAWMLCLGPAYPLAAHLHMLLSTALCHRVPGFIPGSVPP